MEMNLKATVRYDGTGFAGWQVQPNRRTVQGELEAALSQIASQPIRIYGASRTDAGVHALGQVFSFAWPGPLRSERLCKSLSKMLAPEIRLATMEEVPPDFHARRSARGKHYAYTLSVAKAPDPFSARYAWSVRGQLDLEQLAKLLDRLRGEHDFAGFQSSGASANFTVRTLHTVELRPGGIVAACDATDLWHIDLHGDSFLYKMVRNITGTVVEIACGKLAEDRLDELLVAPGPFRGQTAPAHGLTLISVAY